MNDPDDPLEAELASLRPRAASAGLRRRLADRLEQPALWRSPRGWAALAGGLAAAGLAAAVLLGRGKPREGPAERADVGPAAVPAREVPDTQPTLRAYARALARSPEELDALLAEHAARAPERNQPPAPVYAFTRSDADLHPFRGEP